MSLLFYYHIPVIAKNDEIYVPGYLAGFLDSLASNVDHLYLLGHCSNKKDAFKPDNSLKSKNITFIDLGLKTNILHRFIFGKSIVNNALKDKDLSNVTKLLIRCPTPLLMPVWTYFKNTVNKSILVVGDYQEVANNIKSINIKSIISKFVLKRLNTQLLKLSTKSNVFVNSSDLKDKFLKYNKQIIQIKTTTLDEDSFYEPSSKIIFERKHIHILYTGRIDLAKGLSELFNAIAKLNKEYDNKFFLDIVGWEDDPNLNITKHLTQIADSLNFKEFRFHGKKSVGNELNQMYRNSDIFIIPSYHEGFPRVIWEAMANSLPVITTNVGGIPAELKNKETAILIEPKSVTEICSAINLLSSDTIIYRKLVNNGFKKAKTVTNANQIKLIINNL